MTQKENQLPDMRQSNVLKHDLPLRMVKALNALLVMLPFAVCWLAYYDKSVMMYPSTFRSVGVIALFLFLYCFFGRVYDAFYVSFKRISEMFVSQLMAILMADGCMFIVLWLLNGTFPNLLPALLALVGQVLLSLGWCRTAHGWYFSRFSSKKAAIIYDVRQGMESLIGQYGLEKKFAVQATYHVDECIQQIEVLEKLDVVFLCGVHSHERNIILKYCIAHRITVYMIPRVGDVIMSGAKRMHMFHLPILRAERYNPPFEYVVGKRIFDIVCSAAVIVVASPIMLAVAIAIKAYDGGPVLYRQTRLTKDGAQFSVLKFRSMKTDAEQDGVARLSSGEHDDRITPVGRFIRACRLDELPQVFNIFAGSMSIVGPRPERPEIAAQYEKVMPEFALRLQAKAGLTGYAQVYGKYNTIPYDKLQMDLMYIANPSFIEDLRIVFATIQILFQKESTEGVAEGQSTALGNKTIDIIGDVDESADASIDKVSAG